MITELTGVRKATTKEAKEKGAEVVFFRKDRDTGNEYTIYGCECYESWEQWGAPEEVLFNNMKAIEHWRKAGIK